MAAEERTLFLIVNSARNPALPRSPARRRRRPEASSLASSASMSTEMTPKKLTFSLCAGEKCASRQEPQ